MSIKTTRWSPDTCSCIIEYSWDDSLPNDQIVITPTAIISTCPDHMAYTSAVSLYAVLTEENPRKNISHSLILANAPTTVYDIVDGERVFKKGINLSWIWTGTAPNRILTLTVTGITLTTNQKNSIQTKLNDRFGINAVIIQ